MGPDGRVGARVLRHLHGQYLGMLALFIALGGSAYAVAASSVGSREIRNNSIRSKDVRNASLLRKDFKAGQLPQGARGPQGLQGPQGPQGNPGTPGLPGANGVSGYEIVFEDTVSDSSFSKNATVDCPAGKRVIGGGAWASLVSLAIDLSAPIASAASNAPSQTQWTAEANEGDGTASSWSLRVYAICATAG